mgnify:CR=1 FL=1
MIYLIIGTNAYRAQYELQQLAKSLDVRPEKIDAASLDLNKLADTVRGLSLFQERRLIIVEHLSERKDLWDKLGEWASDIAAETYLVLIEPRPDKRTKTFKTLQKTAKLIEAIPLTDRQRPAAEKWLLDYASEHGVKLTKTQASDMVARAIVDDEKSRSAEIDQLQLTHAVAALKHQVELLLHRQRPHIGQQERLGPVEVGRSGDDLHPVVDQQDRAEDLAPHGQQDVAAQAGGRGHGNSPSIRGKWMKPISKLRGVGIISIERLMRTV